MYKQTKEYASLPEVAEVADQTGRKHEDEHHDRCNEVKAPPPCHRRLRFFGSAPFRQERGAQPTDENNIGTDGTKVLDHDRPIDSSRPIIPQRASRQRRELKVVKRFLLILALDVKFRACCDFCSFDEDDCAQPDRATCERAAGE